MITARQFAELREVPYTTVIFWLRKGVLEGAEKQEIPFGRQGFICKCRTMRRCQSCRWGRSRKQADNQADASPAIEEKPAKPAKKAGKKSTKK